MSWLFVLTVSTMVTDVDAIGATVKLVLFYTSFGAIVPFVVFITVSGSVADQLFNPGLEGALLCYGGSLLLYKHGLEMISAP